MAWLLIDNSNTRTKMALGDGDGLLEWRAVIETSELDAVSLRELLEGVDFDGVVCASVVPEKAKLLEDFFKGASQIHFLTHESPHSMGFDLEHPEQIGNDRLSNALALREIYGAPGIAVDFGTAVTFSVVSNDGNFTGGAIAPGMAAMTEYLSSKTAQLPLIELEEPARAIGKTTVEAMRSGAVLGHRGMVREILREIISEIGGRPKVVATGGGAVFAAPRIKEIDLIDTDLTLQGLRLLGGKVFLNIDFSLRGN